MVCIVLAQEPVAGWNCEHDGPAGSVWGGWPWPHPKLIYSSLSSQDAGWYLEWVTKEQQFLALPHPLQYTGNRNWKCSL